MSKRAPLHQNATPTNEYSPNVTNRNINQQQYSCSSSSSGEEDYSDNEANITEDLTQCEHKCTPPPSPYPSPPLRQRLQQQQQQCTKPPSNNTFNCNLIICAIVLVLPLLVYGYTKMVPSKKYCTFEKLRDRAPIQPAKLWLQLSRGIELLLNKQINTPNIYLFLYEDGSNINGSASNVGSLIRDIVSETSMCFDGKKQPVEMTRDDFSAPDGDYGYAITQYKKKIKSGNVLLIVNLNDIPPHAARALHSICDTYNPIARDVVIFLTLRVQTASGAGNMKIAVDALNDLWGKHLKDNELGPLITRVTDQVMQLHTSPKNTSNAT